MRNTQITIASLQLLCSHSAAGTCLVLWHLSTCVYHESGGLAWGRDRHCGTVRKMSRCICTRKGRGGKYRAPIWVLSRLYCNETPWEFLPKFVHKVSSKKMQPHKRIDDGLDWEIWQSKKVGVRVHPVAFYPSWLSVCSTLLRRQVQSAACCRAPCLLQPHHPESELAVQILCSV